MTEAKVTYRGVEVPEDVVCVIWSDQGAGFRAGVDAALGEAEPSTSTGSEETYTEITDDQGDAWFQIPGREDFTLWHNHDSRSEAADYWADTEDGDATTRSEIEVRYGIASERQRTGDTQ